MDDIHFLLDYAIFPLGAGLIWMFVALADIKGRVKVAEAQILNTQKDNERTAKDLGEMETEIKSELKEIRHELSNIPDRVIDRLNKNK